MYLTPTQQATLARAGWGALAALVIGLYLLGVPLALGHLQHVCTSALCEPGLLTPDEVDVLQVRGLSPAQYATAVVAIESALALAYTAVAMLLVWRRATDRMALFTAFTLLTFGGVTFGNLIPTVAEAFSVLRPVASLLHIVGAACFTLFLFVFPDGRFVPRWTRWVALGWILVQVPNTWIPDTSELRESYLELTAPFFAVGIGCAIFAQVYRYRRVSSAVQRQQTKWAVFGFALALGGYATLTGLVSVFPALVQDPIASLAWKAVLYGCIALVPLSIGVAVLRHRLFDVGVLINRTLVYAALTASLGIVYGATVVLLQQALRPLTQGSEMAIAGSTLAAVALVRPLQTRIQAVVDRSFYRRKYDAARTVLLFSTRLRQEMDLDMLQRELLDLTRSTVQPTHASLWLRSPPGAAGPLTTPRPILSDTGPHSNPASWIG